MRLQINCILNNSNKFTNKILENTGLPTELIIPKNELFIIRSEFFNMRQAFVDYTDYLDILFEDIDWNYDGSITSNQKITLLTRSRMKYTLTLISYRSTDNTNKPSKYMFLYNENTKICHCICQVNITEFLASVNYWRQTLPLNEFVLEFNKVKKFGD